MIISAFSFLASSVLRQQSRIARLSSSSLAMSSVELPSVQTFLQDQKQRLRQQTSNAGESQNTPWHLCIGNAAGDADSIVRYVDRTVVCSFSNSMVHRVYGLRTTRTSQRQRFVLLAVENAVLLVWPTSNSLKDERQQSLLYRLHSMKL